MSHLVLKNDLAKVIINPEMGGSILQYQAKLNGINRDILRDSLQANLIGDSASFPLVPFSNRIRNGEFNWQDKQVKLPLNHLPENHVIHGHGWQAHWQVISHSNSELVLEYQHKADAWPFSYSVKQTFMLAGAALKMSLTVVNLSKSDMPTGLGFHPYFTRTQACTFHAVLSKMWAVDNECMPTSIVDAPNGFQEAQGLNINNTILDNAFINFQNKAQLHWPEWQAITDITTSNNCGFLVVYSPKKADFVCIEPVTHMTDAINMNALGYKNTGLESLSSNKTLHIWMNISPESIDDNK